MPAYGTAGNSMYVDPFKTSTPSTPTQQIQPTVTVPPPTYHGPIDMSINNTQQGVDLLKSNQQQAAALGVKLPGATFTPTTTSTGQQPTTPTTSSTDQNQKDLQDAQAQRAQQDADYQMHSQQVQNTIQNIQNGTTPLTSGQQAQIDGLKQQFQTMIDQQALTNKGASGLGNIRGYQKGAAEYDPTFQVKTIGAIVTAGQNKIADLNTKMASAVAALTQSFHDNDIAAVKEAWGIYQDAAKAHAATIEKTVEEAQVAIKDAQAEQKLKQDEADKQAQYELDVAKFSQTQDQDSFDNAFKIEQEKFAEQQKTNTFNLDVKQAGETARHNKATEAVAAFNAGMGAGGGSNGIGISQSATIGPGGTPDPASQKQVLDQITAKYGPMTAVAIKGLATYEMNPNDWSSRVAKGGMNREQAVTLAKMYDPTYSDTQYSIRAGYLKNLASSQTGTIGSAVNAANKSINHLTAYVTTMGQLTSGPGSLPGGAGETKLGNTIGNFIGSITNPQTRQQIAAANTEGLGVAEELAKFFKGSGTVDVASIEAWKNQLSTNATPADVKGTTQGAITLLAGQLETLAEQYQSTMGKAPRTDFLNPSARASLSSLKNQGYDVPIEGIPYTDKNAYLANGGNQASLTKAYQQLVQANDPQNPPTPENVLELAQLY